jgi:hypothetical protein
MVSDNFAPDLEVVETIEVGYHSVPRTLAPGDRVYQFRGATYGVISHGEVAISLGGSKVNPFHGVPRSAVAPCTTRSEADRG